MLGTDSKLAPRFKAVQSAAMPIVKDNTGKGKELDHVKMKALKC